MKTNSRILATTAALALGCVSLANSTSLTALESLRALAPKAPNSKICKKSTGDVPGHPECSFTMKMKKDSSGNVCITLSAVCGAVGCSYPEVCFEPEEGEPLTGECGGKEFSIGPKSGMTWGQIFGSAGCLGNLDASSS